MGSKLVSCRCPPEARLPIFLPSAHLTDSSQSAAKKVGNFVKTTGAKIAKFGLKVYATAASVASRVANFIPGVGKGISKALSGVSKVADFASDKIHANLGKKLEKGMNVMNKIQNPVSK
jgi:hypothetical protein